MLNLRSIEYTHFYLQTFLLKSLVKYGGLHGKAKNDYRKGKDKALQEGWKKCGTKIERKEERLWENLRKNGYRKQKEKKEGKRE